MPRSRSDGTGVSTVADGPGIPRQPAWIPEPPDPAAPAIELEKVATPRLSSPPAAGDTIGYDFKVPNTGNVTLSDVALEDDLVEVGGCDAATLAPGASTTCSAEYAITQADVDAGEVHNSAEACGTPEACDTASTTTPIARVAELQLDKSASPGTYGRCRRSRTARSCSTTRTARRARRRGRAPTGAPMAW